MGGAGDDEGFAGNPGSTQLFPQKIGLFYGNDRVFHAVDDEYGAADSVGRRASFRMGVRLAGLVARLLNTPGMRPPRALPATTMPAR